MGHGWAAAAQVQSRGCLQPGNAEHSCWPGPEQAGQPQLPQGLVCAQQHLTAVSRLLRETCLATQTSHSDQELVTRCQHASSAVKVVWRAATRDDEWGDELAFVPKP